LGEHLSLDDVMPGNKPVGEALVLSDFSDVRGLVTVGGSESAGYVDVDVAFSVWYFVGLRTAIRISLTS
jgi:hypothetical protein